ncbi:MAG: hypothetical protein KatS3mg007_1831 [Thermoanaerobaculum sp.]|nr:MAG: hypothetical protein KatS3mg007_1831 [Thermoanaerobaculum sp.]
MASVYPSGVEYVHSDHLGSPRKVTDGSGNVKAYSDFYPFGLPAATNGIQPRWFSGYELEHQNTASAYTDDLYFLHARWYFPQLARFLSPDPVRGFVGLGQSFNLYGYVTNNPINLVDPWGLAAKEGGPGVSNVPQKDGWCSGNSEDPDCSTFHEEVTVFGAVPLVGFRGVAGLPGSWVQAIELYIDRYVAGDTFFGQIRATSDLRDWWATFRRGEYWGTGYGQRALDYYAGVIADPQAGLGEQAGAYLGGFFAALWTPESYFDTAATLGLAGTGLELTRVLGLEVNVLSRGNIVKIISRKGRWGFRIDPAHHGKPWGHRHWWRW